MAIGTNKPLGSADPRDLSANAENLDIAVNSRESLEWSDRFGDQRLTIHAMEIATPDAIAARDAAEAAQAAAELARDAALIQGGVYVDEPTGRAAVADGVAFKVQGSGDVAAYEYRRTDSAASVLIASYPSSARVDSVSRRNDRMDAIALSLRSQGVDTSLATSVLSIDKARFNNSPAPSNSVLDSIEVKINSPGTFSFFSAAKQLDDKWLLTVFLTRLLGTSPYTLTAADFGVVDVAAGEMIGIYSADGAGTYQTTAAGGGSYSISGLPSVATAATAASSVRIGLNATFADKTVKNSAEVVSEDLPGAVRFGASTLAGMSAGAAFARVSATPTPVAGILAAVNIYVMAAGDGVATVKVYAPTGIANIYSVVASEVVSGLVPGICRLALSSLIRVTPGCLVGIYAKSLTLGYLSGGGADYTAATAGDATGTVGLGVSTHRWNINAEVIPVGSVRYKSELAYRTLQNAAPAGESQLVFDAGLAGSIPPYMQTSGAWTQTSEGVQASGTGSWTTYVGHKHNSTLDRFQLLARVKVNDIASIFALVSHGLDAGGSAFEVDAAAGLLRAYPAWNSTAGNPAAATVTQAIGFALVAGREYSVKWVKEIAASAVRHRFSITDTVTRQQSELLVEWLTAGGSGWGKKDVVFRSGDIVVKRLSYSTPMPAKAALAVYGDSRTEGNGYPSNRNDRWHQLVSAAIGGNVFVSGMGGATSTQLTARLTADYLPFAPKFVLLAVGTNDTDLALWTANMQSMIALVVAKKGTPVLATMPPRADRQDFLNSANAWIIDSGHRYIDFAAALTLNSDRVTWRPGFNDGDMIHENIDGQLSNYAQVQVDLPEIFA